MIQMKKNDTLKQDVSDGGKEIGFQICLGNQVQRIAYTVGKKENRKDEAKGLELATSSFPLLTESAKTHSSRFNWMVEDQECHLEHTE